MTQSDNDTLSEVASLLRAQLDEQRRLFDRLHRLISFYWAIVIICVCLGGLAGVGAVALAVTSKH